MYLKIEKSTLFAKCTFYGIPNWHMDRVKSNFSFKRKMRKNVKFNFNGGGRRREEKILACNFPQIIFFNCFFFLFQNIQIVKRVRKNEQRVHGWKYNFHPSVHTPIMKKIVLKRNSCTWLNYNHQIYCQIKHHKFLPQPFAIKWDYASSYTSSFS